MRLWAFVILPAVLASGAPNSSPPAPQSTEEKPKAKSKNQFFTGNVTAIDDSSITVNRVVLERFRDRDFSAGADTRFEGGRPRIGSQVTLRYVSIDDEKCAVHIILRRSPK